MERARVHLKLLPHGVVLVDKLTEYLQRADVLVLCSGSGAWLLVSDVVELRDEANGGVRVSIFCVISLSLPFPLSLSLSLSRGTANLRNHAESYVVMVVGEERATCTAVLLWMLSCSHP